MARGAAYACLFIAGSIISGYVRAFGFRFTAPMFVVVVLCIAGGLLMGEDR